MNILILEDTNTFVEEFVDILKNNNLFTDAHFFCLGDHFEKIDDTKVKRLMIQKITKLFL